MCGLAGILAFKGAREGIKQEVLEKMQQSMVHRGPDGKGTWIAANNRIGLTHRRLAILDLTDAASQPMTNDDASLYLVYNGEIYNHQEIRQELEVAHRFNWRTDHSDTEVLLRAFEVWGIDCVKRFRGMFAFAIWDARKRELWLARDRIGIKPLYYSVHNNKIVFASEIKAILQDPEQISKVDEHSLYHYLSFLTTPAPHTLFKGIEKLEGGTWLKVGEGGSIRKQRYWDVWDNVAPMEDVREVDLASQVLEELRSAVALRKVSDVPVGVYLSGGIDSSTNAALFAENEVNPINTFSIGYAAEYPSYKNELAYARKMATRIGANYHERVLSMDDMLALMPTMAYMQDEPIADPVCIPLYYVSKLARDNGIKVCQVGEGADELFCGYPQWSTFIKLQSADNIPFPRSLKKLGLAALGKLGLDQGRPYEWLRRGAAGVPIFWGGAESFTQRQKQQLLTPHLSRCFEGYSSWEALAPIHTRFLNGAPDKSILNWMSYLDLNLRLPELLLMRVDKMAMATGVEARVPFLDHKFVELAMSIPASYKLRQGNLKHILKQAVRGVIPDEIIDRPKQGFGVPLQEWYLEGFGSNAGDILERMCRNTAFFNVSEVRRLLQENHTSQIWVLVNFALWLEQFQIDG